MYVSDRFAVICRCLLVACVAWLLPMAGIHAVETTAVSSGPDHCFQAGRVSDYVAEAKRHLEEDPSAADAPRVAFDLLVVATAEKDQDLAKEMKGRLLLDYSDSLYAKYVLVSLADAAKFRELLGEIIKQQDDPFTSDFAAKFTRAVARGLGQWGEQLLSGDEFLLKTALLAHAAGEYRLHMAARSKLATAKAETRQVAAAAFDPISDESAKLLALHQLDNGNARFFERFFISRLTDEQRDLPKIRKVIVENHLKANRFGEALPVIEGLLADAEDAQVLFWHGWCLSSQDRPEDALAALADLQQKYPQSPWSARGASLAKRIESRDANLRACAEAMANVVAQMKQRGLEVIEGVVTWHRDDGRSVEVYFGLIPETGHLEVVVERGGEMLLGYRTSQQESVMYFQGEPMIHAFAGAPIYPVPELNVNVQPNGTFGFNWNVQLKNSPDGISGFLGQLAASPALTTAAGWEMLVRPFVAKGCLPETPIHDASGTRFRFVRPVAAHPEEDWWELQVGPEGNLASVGSETFACTKLRYGDGDSVQLSPPKWPELPVARQEKTDPAAMFRLLGAAASLFASDDKPTAARPGITRR